MTNLQYLRENRFLSIRKLSEISGINKNTIVDIENGTTKHPRRDTMEKLAQVMGVDVIALYGLRAEIGSEA